MVVLIRIAPAEAVSRIQTQAASTMSPGFFGAGQGLAKYFFLRGHMMSPAEIGLRSLDGRLAGDQR